MHFRTIFIAFLMATSSFSHGMEFATNPYYDDFIQFESPRLGPDFRSNNAWFEQFVHNAIADLLTDLNLTESLTRAIQHLNTQPNPQLSNEFIDRLFTEVANTFLFVTFVQDMQKLRKYYLSNGLQANINLFLQSLRIYGETFVQRQPAQNN